MKERKKDHVSNDGEQMQGLEDRIRKQLEKLNIIDVYFDYGNLTEKDPPRFSYRLREGFKNPKNCPLANRIKTRICMNFSNVYGFASGEDVKTIDGEIAIIYTETLLMAPDKIRDAYQLKKALLNSFLNELENYNR